jgi:hypothetical protein
MALASVLPPNECALVSSNDMTELEIFAPDLPDGKDMPRVLAFLLACFTRYHRDPNFVDEQISWLGTQSAF